MAIDDGTAVAERAAALLRALLTLDARQTAEVVDGALAAGHPIAWVADELIAPAMRRVGDLWSRGEVSVAEEHAATEIVEALLTPLVHRRADTAPRAVVCAVAGDRHVLPARMAAAVAADAGWSVDLLGADVPPEDVAGFARRRGAALVVLCAAMAEGDPTAARTARLVRADGGPAVLGGGAGLTDAAASLDALCPSFAALDRQARQRALVARQGADPPHFSGRSSHPAG